MPNDYKHLHELEDELIQIMGLMKAVQILIPDKSELICVANALEERLNGFEKHFYEWFDQ